MSFCVQIALISAITIGSTVDTLAQQAGSTAPHDAPKGNAILVNLSQPIYPPLARQANIHGEVDVTVTVHPNGTFEASFQTGHPMLKQAALDSARQSRFECRACHDSVSYLLV